MTRAMSVKQRKPLGVNARLEMYSIIVQLVQIKMATVQYCCENICLLCLLFFACGYNKRGFVTYNTIFYRQVKACVKILLMLGATVFIHAGLLYMWKIENKGNLMVVKICICLAQSKQ